MKTHLGGQKFQSNNELKHSVQNWLHSQDKTFYAAGICNLQDDAKNVLVCRENIMKMSESLAILAYMFFLQNK
jgi:hypothetical protein